VAETLAAAYAIKNPNRDLKDLSFQELFDYCCSNLDRVYKHFYVSTLWHVCEKGIRDTKSYLVTGRKRKCRLKIANEVIWSIFLFLFFIYIYIFFRSRKRMHSGKAMLRPVVGRGICNCF
jgi:hypothetical protein